MAKLENLLNNVIEQMVTNGMLPNNLSDSVKKELTMNVVNSLNDSEKWQMTHDLLEKKHNAIFAAALCILTAAHQHKDVELNDKQLKLLRDGIKSLMLAYDPNEKNLDKRIDALLMKFRRKSLEEKDDEEEEKKLTPDNNFDPLIGVIADKPGAVSFTIYAVLGNYFGRPDQSVNYPTSTSPLDEESRPGNINAASYGFTDAFMEAVEDAMYESPSLSHKPHSSG